MRYLTQLKDNKKSNRKMDSASKVDAMSGLVDMFGDQVEKEVIELVMRECSGDVEKAVDALLNLLAGTSNPKLIKGYQHVAASSIQQGPWRGYSSVLKQPRPESLAISNGWRVNPYQNKPKDVTYVPDRPPPRIEHPAYERIYRHIKGNKNLLIILRGCPGSGKSYLATLLKNEFGGVMLSADDYFTDKYGKYSLNASYLPIAHSWNQQRAKQSLKDNESPVIIDNTNTQKWEMQPYVCLAVEFKYEIEILEPNTPWRYHAKELARRNKHGVPVGSIQAMLGRFERNVTIESILSNAKFSITANVRPNDSASSTDLIMKKNGDVSSERMMRSSSAGMLLEGPEFISVSQVLEESAEQKYTRRPNISHHEDSSDEHIQKDNKMDQVYCQAEKKVPSLDIGKERREERKRKEVATMTALEDFLQAYFAGRGDAITLKVVSVSPSFKTNSLPNMELEENDKQCIANISCPLLSIKELSQVLPQVDEDELLIYAEENDWDVVKTAFQLVKDGITSCLGIRVQSESSENEAIGPTIPPSCNSESDLSDSSDDIESVLKLRMEKSFAISLISLFGSVTDALPDGDIEISISYGMAKKIHDIWKKEAESSSYPNNIKISDDMKSHGDELLARCLQELEREEVPPSQELLAVEGDPGVKKLIEKYPGAEPKTLVQVFNACGCNLDKALHIIECSLPNTGKPITVYSHGALEEMEKKRKEAQMTQNRAGHSTMQERSPQEVLTSPCPSDLRAEWQIFKEKRNECYRKAQEAHQKNMGSVASYYSQMGQRYSEQMHAAKNRSSQLILELVNQGNDRNTLDLHFLHVDEALVVLHDWLRIHQVEMKACGESMRIVRIITGWGKHSYENQGRLQPEVANFLHVNKFRFQLRKKGEFEVGLDGK